MRFSIHVLLIASIPMLPAVYADTDASCYLAELKGDRINLRKEPMMGPHDGVQADKGDRFPVRVVPAEKDWIRITEGKHEGRHIHSSLVKIRLRENHEACKEVTASAESAVDQLNVRERPNLKAPVAGQLGIADSLNVAPAEGEWLKVLWPTQFEGKFVHRDLVDIQLPAAAE